MTDLPDSQADSNQPTPWPEKTFPLKDVQDWVRSALDLPSLDVIPVKVYVAYIDSPDERMTARLSVKHNAVKPFEVVFKGNRMPLLSGSARAHALVSHHCGDSVPHILAWNDDSTDGSSCLLYEPFEGRAVGDSGDPALLVETARTLAYIQNTVAESSQAENAGLRRFGAEDALPTFDAVFDHIQAHIGAWEDDEGGKLSKALGLPAAEVLDILSIARRQVSHYADEVIALNLPTTIDHGDLHGGNAVVQDDGNILIYDWETATVGCPLFSVEKLLVAAWSMDKNLGGHGPWGYTPNTPTQALVRDAYLGALGKTNISERVFASAMCLATVKEMHAEIVWANLTGWSDGNPEWTAQLIRRMGHHLQNAEQEAG